MRRSSSPLSRRATAVFASLVGLVGLAGACRAQTFTWTGATDANWGTAGNWTEGLPTSGATTSLVFDTATGLTGLNTLPAGFTLNALAFDAGSGVRTITGNSLTFDGVAPTLAMRNTTGTGNTVFVLNSTLNQTLTVHGGVDLDHQLLVGTAVAGGFGPVSQGGQFSGAGGLTFASGLTALKGSSSYTGATLVQSGATVGAFTSGAFGLSSGVTVEAGGTVQLQLLASGAARTTVGRALNLAGTLESASADTQGWSGAITVTSDTAKLDAFNSGTLRTTGPIDLNGHTLNVTTGLLGLGNRVEIAGVVTGAGTLHLAGSSVSLGSANTFTGAVNVTAGTVSVSGEGAFGAATNTLTLGGGSVLSVQPFFALSATRTVTSAAGGFVLVPNNGFVSIAAPIDGPGSVTVTGIGIGTGGILTLTGDNTFTGGLVIGAGSSVLAGADTVLGASGGALTLGGGLAFSESFTLAASRVVNVTGTSAFVAAGAGVTATVGANLTGTGRLTIAGGSGGQLGGTVVLAGTNTHDGGVVVNGATLALDSDARLGGPAGVLNFAGANRLLATAAFTVAATRSTTFGNLNVDTNGFDVTFAQRLDGTGLTKEGAGVLRFDSANASTQLNGMFLNAGTLRAGVANAFGTGAAITAAAGTVVDLNGFDHLLNGISGAGDVHLGGGTLTMKSGGLVDGGISGAGAVVLQGSGSSFLFNGANTFQGGLTLRQGGSLAIAGTAALGAPGGAVTIDGGTLGTSGFATAPVVLDAAVPLTIGAGGAHFSAGGQSLVIASALGGSAPIGVSGGGDGHEVRFANAANTFVSPLHVGASAQDAALGLVADGSLGAAANVLTLGDRFFDGETTRTSQGTLRAFADLTLPATRVVRTDGDGGAIDTNGFTVRVDTVLAELTGGTELVKSGAGTLLLNGANTFTGETRVEAGVLGGNGSVAGALAVNGGATFAPGASAGLFTIGGDLTLAEGSLTLLEIGGLVRGVGGYDAFDVGGTFFAGGTLTLDLINGYTFTGGESFQVINAGVFSGAFSTVNLPVLSAGFTWDDTRLATAGILAVSAGAIPEPSTWALLAGVVALAGAVGRRAWAAKRDFAAR